MSHQHQQQPYHGLLFPDYMVPPPQVQVTRQPIGGRDRIGTVSTLNTSLFSATAYHSQQESLPHPHQGANISVLPSTSLPSWEHQVPGYSYTYRSAPNQTTVIDPYSQVQPQPPGPYPSTSTSRGLQNTLASASAPTQSQSLPDLFSPLPDTRWEDEIFAEALRQSSNPFDMSELGASVSNSFASGSNVFASGSNVFAPRSNAFASSNVAGLAVVPPPSTGPGPGMAHGVPSASLRLGMVPGPSMGAQNPGPPTTSGSKTGRPFDSGPTTSIYVDGPRPKRSRTDKSQQGGQSHHPPATTSSAQPQRPPRRPRSTIPLPTRWSKNATIQPQAPLRKQPQILIPVDNICVPLALNRARADSAAWISGYQLLSGSGVKREDAVVAITIADLFPSYQITVEVTVFHEWLRTKCEEIAGTKRTEAAENEAIRKIIIAKNGRLGDPAVVDMIHAKVVAFVLKIITFIVEELILRDDIFGLHEYDNVDCQETLHIHLGWLATTMYHCHLYLTHRRGGGQRLSDIAQLAMECPGRLTRCVVIHGVEFAGIEGSFRIARSFSFAREDQVYQQAGWARNQPKTSRRLLPPPDGGSGRPTKANNAKNAGQVQVPSVQIPAASLSGLSIPPIDMMISSYVPVQLTPAVASSLTSALLPPRTAVASSPVSSHRRILRISPLAWQRSRFVPGLVEEETEPSQPTPHPMTHCPDFDFTLRDPPSPNNASPPNFGSSHQDSSDPLNPLGNDISLNASPPTEGRSGTSTNVGDNQIGVHSQGEEGEAGVDEVGEVINNRGDQGAGENREGGPRGNGGVDAGNEDDGANANEEGVRDDENTDEGVRVDEDTDEEGVREGVDVDGEGVREGVDVDGEGVREDEDADEEGVGVGEDAEEEEAGEEPEAESSKPEPEPKAKDKGKGKGKAKSGTRRKDKEPDPNAEAKKRNFVAPRQYPDGFLRTSMRGATRDEVIDPDLLGVIMNFHGEGLSRTTKRIYHGLHKDFINPRSGKSVLCMFHEDQEKLAAGDEHDMVDLSHVFSSAILSSVFQFIYDRGTLRINPMDVQVDPNAILTFETKLCTAREKMAKWRQEEPKEAALVHDRLLNMSGTILRNNPEANHSTQIRDLPHTFDPARTKHLSLPGSSWTLRNPVEASWRGTANPGVKELLQLIPEGRAMNDSVTVTVP